MEFANYIDKSLESISEEIAKDVKFLYEDNNLILIDHLHSYNYKKWLDERPNGLINVISKLCSVLRGDLADETKRAFYLDQIVELIYSTTYARILLPIAFLENLQTYSLSNSKLQVNYNDSPGRSYSFLQKWILSQASKPTPVP